MKDIPDPCVDCTHFIGYRAGTTFDEHGIENKEVLVCVAFPDGIPPTVLKAQNFHRKPMKGDNNIQWQPLQGGEE